MLPIFKSDIVLSGISVSQFLYKLFCAKDILAEIFPRGKRWGEKYGIINKIGKNNGKECCFAPGRQQKRTMELWDVYDIDRQKTGRLAERTKGSFLPQGDYHLVVHICLFNTNGELLIQQRQLDKDGYPGLWDVTAAGSALAGENSTAAAARELYEEMGVRHDFTKERPYYTINFPQGFDDVYLIERTDIELSDLRLQPEEVRDAKWATLEGIEAMLDSGEFVPYYRHLIRLWFDMIHHRGSTTRE